MAEEGNAHPSTPKQQGETGGPEAERSDAKGAQDDALRLDQLGAIVDKGLDLVEVGLALGIKLANRLSSALQVQVGDAAEAAGAPYGPQGPAYGAAGPYPGPQGPAYGSAEPYPGPQMSAPPRQPPREPEAPPQYGFVINRTPLGPGDPVRVSFTINNDSPTAAKDLSLRVEGFVGHVHGARFDGTAFSVEPADQVIAPMDFDKFTLYGAIPDDAIGDAYGGWIVVSGEEDLRIPVRLVVSTQP
jgi:hypothetical protein